jgi:glucan phosphorylase
MPPEEEMASNVREQMKIAERWNSIRLLSDEEAEKQLSGQELDNFKKYHETIKADFAKMRKIAEMMTQEFVKISPKTKKQRKRDKWARVQAQAAADLAAAALVKK